MPLSNYARDRFIAPGLSSFTQANIRDMAEQTAAQASYTAEYVLSTMFRGRFESPTHQQLFNFLRRSHTAFRAYQAARASTLEFLRSETDADLVYVEAVGHWETFIGCAWQALRFLTRGKPILFTTGDGSWAEKLNRLHSAAKHAEERIENGELVDDALLSVWLTNEGLRNIDTVLSFDELGIIAETLALWANYARDPATMIEKIEAATRGGDENEPDET